MSRKARGEKPLAFYFAMKLITAVSFVLLFITIPIGLISVSAKVYGSGANWLVVSGKLLASLSIYLTASVIVPVIILFVVIGPDPGSRGKLNFGFAAQSICLLLVAVYGFTGWLLCSLVNGKFIKSYSEFNLSYEKPQSISLSKL